MIQHNHWKLNQLQSKYSKIALWGLGAILLVLGLFSIPINYEVLSTAIGIVLLVLGFIFTLFEKVLWKANWVQTVMKKCPLISNYWTPVLEGRWTGTFVRDDKIHKFVLEIIQTYSTISCVTYSTHSSSKAIAAELLFDERTNTYQLAYYWHAKTSSTQVDSVDRDYFNGFSLLDISINEIRAVKLEGAYFTDRQPTQTHGTLSFVFEQKELKQSFQ